MLTSKMFEDAATLIEEKGWYPGVGEAYCLWTATLVSSGWGEDGDIDSDLYAKISEFLIGWFGFTQLGEVFNINDSHSKEWAVAELRKMAHTHRRW